MKCKRAAAGKSTKTAAALKEGERATGKGDLAGQMKRPTVTPVRFSE